MPIVVWLVKEDLKESKGPSSCPNIFIYPSQETEHKHRLLFWSTREVTLQMNQANCILKTAFILFNVTIKCADFCITIDLISDLIMTQNFFNILCLTGMLQMRIHNICFCRKMRKKKSPITVYYLEIQTKPYLLGLANQS